MRPFAYERAGDARRRPSPRVARADAGAAFLGGGTNLVDLMKLGVERARRCSSTSRGLPLDAIERDRRTAGCGSAPACATATSPPHRARARALSRARRRRCSPAPPGSCATSPRSAATCCSAPAARTSRTSQAVQQARPGHRLPGARRATTATSRSSATPRTASPPTRRTWPSRSPRSTRVVHVAGPARRARRVAARRVLPAARRRARPRHGARARRPDHRGRAAAAAASARPRATARSRDRASFAFALVSVAAALDVDGRHGARLRGIAFGGVAHKPWRAARAEDGAARRDRRPPSAFAAAADAELAGRRPAARQRLQGAARPQPARPHALTELVRARP